MLTLPYSDYTTLTLLDWIKSQGMYFDQIIGTNHLAATNNGDTVDWFMVLDNDPEVVQLALLFDIELGDPLYDLVGTMEQAVMLKTGGIMFRHPAGCYIGKGI